MIAILRPQGFQTSVLKFLSLPPASELIIANTSRLPYPTLLSRSRDRSEIACAQISTTNLNSLVLLRCWLLLGIILAATVNTSAPKIIRRPADSFPSWTPACPCRRTGPEILKVVADLHSLPAAGGPTPSRRYHRPLDLRSGRPLRPAAPSLVRQRTIRHHPAHHGFSQEKVDRKKRTLASAPVQRGALHWQIIALRKTQPP